MSVSPEQFRLISSIFAKACEMPEPERDAYLDSACENEAELRTQIQCLLDDDQRPAFSLESPPIAMVMRAKGEAVFDDSSGRTALPSGVGDYEIVGILGEGGMGTVYEARQKHPTRSVALKVLRAGIVSKSARRRLQIEAEILGRLHHPGIASIYEAGVAVEAKRLGGSQEQPFFAMELIRGEPLDVYVRKNELPARKRLEVFAQICDAVQHAHENGIIHRDLKPGNILVDASGAPKILDFGIARITDADIRTTTLKTGVGQLIGTIAYMSPEQVSGDSNNLDRRSDVYALGVLGYELLAGRLPVQIEDVPITEAILAVRDQEPPPLGSLDSSLRGDLQLIFQQALEKDRSLRYQSVSDFADDVRHFLGNEPISARPRSTLYEIRKLTSRHKALTSSLALTLVVLVVFGIWMSVLYRQADRQMIRAQLSQQFLEKMLSSIDPGVAMGKDTSIIRGILADAAEQIGEDLAGQPEAEADIRTTIGTTYLSVGLAEAARPQLEIALTLRKKALGESHHSVAELVRMLAECAGKEGHRKKAIELASQAVELFREHYPDDLRTANALQTSGWITSELAGNHAEAVALFRESLEIAERHGGKEQDIYATSNHRLAVALWRWRRLAEAEPIARETLALKRTMYGTDHPSVASSIDLLAQILTSQKKFTDSLPLLRESLDMHERLFGKDHPAYATALNSLASFHSVQGDYESAEPLARECLKLVTELRGESSHETAFAWMNLASIVNKKGDYTEAERLYRIANDRFRAIFPPEHPYLGSPLARLAEMMERYGNHADAAPIWRQLVKETSEAFPKGHPSHALTIRRRQQLGRCLMRIQECNEAETLLVACYDEIRSQEAPKKKAIASAAKDLVELYESCSLEEKAAAYREIADGVTQ